MNKFQFGAGSSLFIAIAVLLPEMYKTAARPFTACFFAAVLMVMGAMLAIDAAQKIFKE